MKHLLGGLLLAAPFVAYFVYAASSLGVWGAVSVFVATVAISAVILLGVWLVTS